MASGGDIRAGKAYVELYVKNAAFIKGLADASKRLKDFGNGIAFIGKGMMAASAAGLAPVTAMLAGFERTGSTLNDMAARTGMAVETLSALGYAAGQTGTDLESVELAVRKMQKNLVEAAGGSKTVSDALGYLGLTIAELKGLSPDEQFDRIGKAIAGVQNPTQRTAVAMALLGKSATLVLPMLAEMDTLTARARELGVMSTADAAAADALGDSWADLRKAAASAGNAIVSSLAPAVTQITLDAAKVLGRIKEWAKENRGLIAAFIGVTAAIGASGVAFFAFGKMVALAGAALGGLRGFLLWAAGGMQLVVTLLAALISPAGLAVVAITALGAGLLYLARNTAPVQAIGDAMRGFAGGIREMVATVAEDAKAAWSGIAAALSAGDLESAWKVIVSTIHLEWVRLTDALQAVWERFKVWYADAVSGIAIAFTNVSASALSVWTSMLAKMKSLWIDFETSTFTEWAAGIAGWVMSPTQEGAAEAAAQARAQVRENRGAAPDRLKQIEGEAAASRAKIERDRQAAVDAIAADVDRRQFERDQRLEAAQKELDDAKKAQSEAVAAAQTAAAGQRSASWKLPMMPELEAMAAARDRVAGTFSASAVAGLGVGSAAERTARAVEKLTGLLQIDKALLDEQKRLTLEMTA